MQAYSGARALNTPWLLSSWARKQRAGAVKSDIKGEDDGWEMKEGGGGEEEKIRLLAVVVCSRNPYTGWTGALIGAVGYMLIDTWRSTAYRSACNFIPAPLCWMKPCFSNSGISLGFEQNNFFLLCCRDNMYWQIFLPPLEKALPLRCWFDRRTFYRAKLLVRSLLVR